MVVAEVKLETETQHEIKLSGCLNDALDEHLLLLEVYAEESVDGLVVEVKLNELEHEPLGVLDGLSSGHDDQDFGLESEYVAEDFDEVLSGPDAVGAETGQHYEVEMRLKKR